MIPPKSLWQTTSGVLLSMPCSYRGKESTHYKKIEMQRSFHYASEDRGKGDMFKVALIGVDVNDFSSFRGVSWRLRQ